ncbi:hypothetical protein B566_EDAN011986 [Ephemera danica]|nr:hypothetical protein B566_EDAN011986 [Ephemera danica]
MDEWTPTWQRGGFTYIAGAAAVFAPASRLDYCNNAGIISRLCRLLNTLCITQERAKVLLGQ